MTAELPSREAVEAALTDHGYIMNYSDGRPTRLKPIFDAARAWLAAPQSVPAPTEPRWEPADVAEVRRAASKWLRDSGAASAIRAPILVSIVLEAMENRGWTVCRRVAPVDAVLPEPPAHEGRTAKSWAEEAASRKRTTTRLAAELSKVQSNLSAARAREARCGVCVQAVRAAVKDGSLAAVDDALLALDLAAAEAGDAGGIGKRLARALRAARRPAAPEGPTDA